jgi:hypothetical protein
MGGDECEHATGSGGFTAFFDLWMEAWRKKVAKGDVIVVRYADDLVMGFEHRTEPSGFCVSFRTVWPSSAWN